MIESRAALVLGDVLRAALDDEPEDVHALRLDRVSARMAELLALGGWELVRQPPAVGDLGEVAGDGAARITFPPTIPWGRP